MLDKTMVFYPRLLTYFTGIWYYLNESTTGNLLIFSPILIPQKILIQEMFIMSAFQAVYVPAGVPTFHLESAEKEFQKSIQLLKSIDPEVVVPLLN